MLDLDCDVKNIGVLNAITSGIPIKTEKYKEIENTFNLTENNKKAIWVDITKI